ncbi:hypothetical protein LINPERHAP2_LOCUS38632 [Linum perenne]
MRSISRAKLRAAVDGLLRTRDVDAREVVLQMDSQTAISILQVVGEVTHQHGVETMAFSKIFCRDWEVMITHIYREANRLTDFLANKGL